MKRKILYSATALGVVAIMGTSIASADQFIGPEDDQRNRNPEIVAQHQAEMLSFLSEKTGVDQNILKEARNTHTLQQILEDNGIDTNSLHYEMRELRKANIQAHVEQMITDGTITQEQADGRLERIEKVGVRGMNMGRRGEFRHGFGY